MVGSYGIKKIIFVLYFFSIAINCSSDYPSKKIKSIHDFTFLKEGDLVCRLGNGYFSNYFREYASKEKRYSHIGIIGIENNILYVYHSEASELTGIGGVKKEKLEDFLDGIKVYSFFRVNLSEREKELVIAQASKYLDKHTKFDLDFISNNDNELYCTEFVASCINKGINKELIKPTLKLKSKLIFSLDDIYENKNVNSLKN